MSKKEIKEIINLFFNQAIESERNYAAYFARFMFSLSEYADSIADYQERACFLRVAGTEIGFNPVEFWEVVDSAEQRAVTSELAAIEA